jgi:ATP-dependent protease HslVU (ClpYQ) peptidase subunit
MTCIVGVKSGGKVFIGADALATEDNLAIAVCEPKVFRFGPLVIGLAGEFRGAQVLRYAVKPPKKAPTEPMHWLVHTFLPTLRSAYAAHGVTAHPDYLVGVGGRLFEIDDALAVVESSEAFSAIGAGREYALGAYRALCGVHCPGNAEAILRRTLDAAERFCPGVRAPFTVVST